MAGDLTIRLAETSERDFLEALQLRASLEWEEYREALLAHPDAIELPIEQISEGRVFVAEQEGQIVGFCAVLFREQGGVELDGLFVEPSCWGAQIGSRLLTVAEDVARREGAEFLWVISGPRSEGFYAKRGFERIEETPTRFGPAATLRKALA